MEIPESISHLMFLQLIHLIMEFFMLQILQKILLLLKVFIPFSSLS